MAQSLTSINLVAPAFQGINTEDSPLAQDPSFAEIADNAIIDQRGRIACRKGHSVLTTNKTALGSATIRVVHEFQKNTGSNVILSTGNNKIFTGTTTLTDATPGGYSITANNWKIVNFNNNAYLFQAGHAPLIYDGSSVALLSSVAGSGGIVQGNEVLAAFGRLFVTGLSSAPSTIFWSDLLQGHAYTGGSSGNIDISTAWPDGYDQIVALAAHNNFLIIFGQHSIVVYSGASSPASMTLADTVAGIGCVDRDTVQYTGTDVIFLSHTGLKSFGRTIQEKSMPISSLSGNITKDIIDNLQSEQSFFRSVYSPEENFYLLSFVGQDVTYCFDIRTKTANGSYRVTRWPDTGFSAYAKKEDGDLLIGTSNGISQYSGFQDNGQAYRFKYASPGLSFGDSSRIKMVKKLKPTVVGASDTTVFLKWSYDFSGAYAIESFQAANQTPALFGVSEYNESEFAGGTLVTRKSINATGFGTSVVIGVEAEINSSQLSLQEINVMALIGKLA